MMILKLELNGSDKMLIVLFGFSAQIQLFSADATISLKKIAHEDMKKTSSLDFFSLLS